MADMHVIGDLKGGKVLIDRETRSVIIASDDFPPIKFSVDHPFIQGTGNGAHGSRCH
jgi:hypothetical protein